ncbi:hypothetical protein MVEN_02292900 [Mycena venus]|uniref:Uncharacterized protein n=1 Tax=Mycena venus TaxID=2733690 RepID=A0A8H6X5P5_9AGAR|nr:hypothetical protein MVEN_02292900 [Mycena venus]
MLVASGSSRVKDWVEPLLYRTVAVQYSAPFDGYPDFTWDILLAAVRSKPLSFYHSVRHVHSSLEYGPITEANAKAILSVCTHVENLVLQWADALDFLPLIAPLPLKYLGADFTRFFLDHPPTHPLFDHITHLGLGHSDPSAERAEGLSLVPRLTHLFCASRLSWAMPPASRDMRFPGRPHCAGA